MSIILWVWVWVWVWGSVLYYSFSYNKHLVVLEVRSCRPVASQPGGGGLNLDGWNTRRTPPLDIVRVTSWIWKTPPLVDIHKHPPPRYIARMTSSTYSKGGTKLLEGGTKLLKGGTKLLKGGTKLLKGGTKLLKGGTKLLKGGTKSLGWATGGGRTTPPTPPPRKSWLRAWLSHRNTS